MEHGQVFHHCVSIDDWQTKMLADDITLVSKPGTCCPNGTIPGVKHTTNYGGPQILCGFKNDGSVALSTGSSGGKKTCTYNECYMFKLNLECKAGGRQMLNGCCAAPAECKVDACGFKDGCKNSVSSFNNVYGEK